MTLRPLSSQSRVAAVVRAAGLGAVGEKIFNNIPLTLDDAVLIYQHPDLNAVGALANWKREQIHGDRAYFNVNQHINYTNICNKLCRFCAFQRLPGQSGAYVFTPEEAAAKIRATLDQPVTEVHMVAGIDPKLTYDYYLNLVRAVKAARPDIHVKAFTMVEIEQIHKISKKSLEEVFADLKQAGLGSLPGGGAEIFSERVRKLLFPLKIGADRWLEIARTAHRCGLKSNCTMLYGHIETKLEKAEHLLRLRELQTETGGFQTFIPLTFHPENTDIDELPASTAVNDLREIAVARLVLDNIPHIKSYWIQLGVSIAQTALCFGADDLDGTVKEERIYHDAGADTPQELDRDELIQIIRAAGRRPVERDTLYRVVRVESAGAESVH
ncbi:MAG: aminofutalosine synthase MqnE [Planctomycetes bacterium]|nr:aminofutalosine synthase MqnE [Planctomycetota bacterium]